MSDYKFILSKIDALKNKSGFLKDKSNDFIFSALCVKSIYFKNPAFNLDDEDLKQIIVDGPYDGGVDILLSDPASEDSLKEQEILDALIKMWLFYKDMNSGHYEQVNETVQRRFLSLSSETSENAKVHFSFYTSAPKKRVSVERIKKKFSNQIAENDVKFEVEIYFGNDIADEIKEAESRRPCVEFGKLDIDEADNALKYGDDAAIVNVSAFSIKLLYALHSSTLLAKNLRYFIKSKDIDKGINSTIENNPDYFWFRNNGITIVCDDFKIDGKEVKLTNFSIVNGGQTTYLLYKNSYINETNDLFLQCKIIKSQGDNEDDKNTFSLEIAKATNSQKPIKTLDLKANAPEQLRFAQALRDVGVFYQTKRGEIIPKDYKEWYKNTDMTEIGKLCLCAIFQKPCTSRNKPSVMYEDKYYNLIFNKDQQQIAGICRELLYIDYYFRNEFLKKFDKINENEPDKSTRISFAHNARTICIAFVTFAARYNIGNITDEDIKSIQKAAGPNSNDDDILYDLCSDLGKMKSLFSTELFNDKDQFDEIINNLFNAIIDEGIRSYSNACRHDSGITATNYLKKDKNYYIILSDYWRELRGKIKSSLPALSIK